ncbi:hypothetical protein C4565_00465 [Candidatus Parcubacteria bacterium]|nr:MAG: hypothetical protein C4565_00465 [Candidatus Parcubacteria bacterium]
MSVVERRLKWALTVEKLIQLLSEMNPELKVAFVCDYGDHCHTQQVLPIQEVDSVVESGIKETAYSTSGLGLCRNESEEEIGNDVILLR